MKHLLSTFVLVIALAIPAAQVCAADYLVSPLAVNYDVERRDILNGSLTLTNTGDRALRLYAGVNEVATDGEGIIKSFTPPSMTDRTSDPTSWVQITRGRIELAPGESKEIPYTVKMHPTTKPGQYSVFVGFAPGSNQPDALSKIRTGDGKGSLFNISVDQKQNLLLRLEQYSVDRFVINDDGDISVSLQNPGQVPITPGGEIIFYDNRGEEAASVPFNEAGVAIGESSIETFTLSIPNALKLGKYKAYLSVEYGETQRSAVTDSSFFYVAPITQLVIIFLGLLTITVIVTLLVYRRYDVDDHDGTSPVAMFVSTGQSAAADHDIDLKASRHEE